MFGICMFDGPFADDLEKGELYYIGAVEVNRLMVEVCNDRGVNAWYPAECFDVLVEVLSYASYRGPEEDV